MNQGDLSTASLLAMLTGGEESSERARARLRASVGPTVQPIATPMEYSALFSTPLGQTVLRDMVWRFCMSSHYAPGGNASDAVYAQGLKAVVLDIMAQILTADQQAAEEAVAALKGTEHVE